MITEIKNLEITDVQFIGNNILLLSLSNERAFIVPLDKFKKIAALDSAQRKDFEVIDGENLSFLVIDEVYHINELIGIPD